MAETSIGCFWITLPALLTRPQFSLSARNSTGEQQRWRKFRICSSKSGGFSPRTATKSCQTCGGKGAIECPGCKGTGKNKKNGNIFERWKCFNCQGFGLKSCPKCGKGGLTPEQRGER